jgi:hypothetical protein
MDEVMELMSFTSKIVKEGELIYGRLGWLKKVDSKSRAGQKTFRNG